MRALCVLGAIICLSACATVTIQPASMTTSLVSEDSSLTAKAKAFSKQADEEGWIRKTSALAFLKTSLFGASEDEDDAAPNTYAARVEAEAVFPVDIEARIVKDVQTATRSLTALNSEAEMYLANEQKDVARADVVAFEDALVSARKSLSAFEEACELLDDRAPHRVEAVETELEALEAEISVSKSLADDIAKSWQQETSILS